MNVSPLEAGVPNAVRFRYNGFHQTGDIVGRYDDGTYKVTRFAASIRRNVVYKVTFRDNEWVGERIGTEPALI